MAQTSTHMLTAIDLAARGRGSVAPNPLVGAIVVAADGRVVGEGWHEGPGTPHAEVGALTEAGDAAAGGTLYVSLEPCNHTGRTGPCSEAILAAGISRVIIAISDPNPEVHGGGADRLRSAGLVVEIGDGHAEATRQNEAYLFALREGRPFVTLKMAATLDGKIAARDGSSAWITSELAREDVHRMRASAGAIIVGAGTAITDDPHLTVRSADHPSRTPLRVVVDGSGRVPVGGNLTDDAAPTLIATTSAMSAETASAWEAAGAEVLTLADRDHVSLGGLLKELAGRGVDSVLIEGGSTLAYGAVAEGIVDRVVIYFAPRIVGGAHAPSIVGGDGFPTLAAGVQLAFVSIEQMGPDMKVVADVHRDH